MEIQGLTPVDTLYAYVGYAVGLRLGQYLLWGGYMRHESNISDFNYNRWTPQIELSMGVIAF